MFYLGIIIKWLMGKGAVKDTIEKIKCRFSKDTVKVCDEDVVLTEEQILSTIDYASLKQPVFANGYDPKKKTIIMLDDIESTYFLYETAINSLDRINNEKFLDKFNVIYFFGKNVGFTFVNFLKTTDYKIDYAILDITINTIARVDTTTLFYDGVDVAIAIDKKFPDCKIIFNTMHTMNPRNTTVSSFMAKFKDYFGVSIMHYTVEKLSDIGKAMDKFTEKEFTKKKARK